MARIFKVKVSLGTPFRVYRESLNDRSFAPSRKVCCPIFPKCVQSEVKAVCAAIPDNALRDDFAIRRWRSSREVEIRGRIEPSRTYRVARNVHITLRSLCLWNNHFTRISTIFLASIKLNQFGKNQIILHLSIPIAIFNFWKPIVTYFYDILFVLLYYFSRVLLMSFLDRTLDLNKPNCIKISVNWNKLS